MKDRFSRFATATATAAGSYLAFITAATIVIVWAITGSLFKFSTNWQLFINTGTTIVTFLMVFLIQNSQNRESRALQLKLDELIRAVSNADNEMIDVEDDREEELDRLRKRFKELRENDPDAAAELRRTISEQANDADGAGEEQADGPVSAAPSKRDAA